VNLRQIALDALLLAAPDEKCAAVRSIALADAPQQFTTPDRRRLAG
jgi:hypothetical protein